MEVIPNTSSSPDGFYSSDYYVNNLLDYFRDWKTESTSSSADKPFFAFLPFTAPHWPLQCSKPDRDAYKGVYDEGPDALRVKRLAGLMKLGIVAHDVKPADVIASEVSEWDEMTPEEKHLSVRAMETYAGMVTA